MYDSLPDYCQTHWISEIARFPRFQQRVRQHWQQFYNEIHPTLDEFMDKCVAEMAQGGEADHVRWPQYDSHNMQYRVDHFFKTSLHTKVAWLNQQWGTAANLETTPLMRQ